MAFALSSCEFGANAVDGSEIPPKEGTIYEYDNFVEFNFRSVQLSPRVQIKFLSDIATVGGRENVMGFESSADGELMFSEIRDGELWYYFQANRDSEQPLRREGSWVKIPHEGDPETSAEIRDSVFSGNPENAHSIIRRLRVIPMGQLRFYVDGYYFDATKVKVISDYQTSGFDEFGLPNHDEQEILFIDKLGIIAEKITRDEFGQVLTHIVMSDIYQKKQ